MAATPLIFDTTVWIEYLNGHLTPGRALLYDYLDHDKPVLLTPTIVQEVLQGIQDDGQYARVRNALGGFLMLTLPHGDAAVGAAEMYRALRKKGITIRKANDCLIAFYGIHFGYPVVNNDSDFDLIAIHTKLISRKD